MSNEAGSRVGGKGPSGRAGVLVSAFVALALVLPIVGFATLRLYTPQALRDAEANLVAVADLKARQLENWLVERRGDAELLMADYDFSDRAAALASGRSLGRDLDRVQTRLRQLVTSYHYSEAMVVTRGGRIVAAVGEDPYLDTETRTAIERLEAGAVRRVRLYLDARGHSHIEWIAALGAAADRSPVAVAVLRVEAADFVFPLIQTWPGASASGETLLVRREGESVLFLNELRHRKGTALRYALPLSKQDLPAAEAIRVGKPGATFGVDYRGQAVVAAYRPISGTTWFLVDRKSVV